MLKFIYTLCLLCFYSTLVAQNDPILIPYKKGNLWGYADTTGKIVIEPKYDSVTIFTFKKKLSRIWIKDKVGLLNLYNVEVIRPEYDYIKIFRDSFVKLKQNGKFGIYLTNGKCLIKPSFEYLNIEYLTKTLNNKTVYDIYLVAGSNDKNGIYEFKDGQFTLLIPEEYKYANLYNNPNRFECHFENDSIHIYDLNGKLIERSKTLNRKRSKTTFKSENDELSDEEKKLYSEKTSNQVLDQKTIYAAIIEKNTAENSKKIKQIPAINEIDIKKITSPPLYPIYSGSKVGLISITPHYNYNFGESHEPYVTYDTIKPVYDVIDTTFKFSNMFYVKKNNLWGIVNSKDEIIIETKFNELKSDHNTSNLMRNQGNLILKQDNKWGVMSFQRDYSKNNTQLVLKEVIPFKYDYVRDEYNFFIVKSKGKYGVLNSQGNKFLIKPKYDFLKNYTTVAKFGLLITKDKSGQFVYIGYNGVEFFSE